MAEIKLTADEQEFAEKLVELMNSIPEIKALAKKVVDNGGSPQTAFMSLIPPENRAEASFNWPFIQMFLLS